LPRQSTKLGHRPCTVCRHPHRALIEAAKVAGVSGDIIAEKYSVGRDALYRHMRNHVSEEDRASYIADIPLKELAAKAAEEGMSLIGYFSIVRSTLMQQFQLAASLNDRNATATIGRALVEVLREIGKLTGELLSVSGSVNITNNNIAFVQSPAFARIQASLLQALAPFPDARAAVVDALRALDDESAPRAISGPANGKVIDHD
jgi:hypothetical protein